MTREEEHALVLDLFSDERYDYILIGWLRAAVRVHGKNAALAIAAAGIRDREDWPGYEVAEARLRAALS